MKLISTAALSVALMSAAFLSSVGSAQAMGCLHADQVLYSLVESDDNDDAMWANARGFRCNTGEESSFNNGSPTSALGGEKVGDGNKGAAESSEASASATKLSGN
jgi:hypothetical protein